MVLFCLLYNDGSYFVPFKKCVINGWLDIGKWVHLQEKQLLPSFSDKSYGEEFAPK